MKKVIDNIEEVTGWSASAGASVYGLNTYTEFRACNTDASLIVKFTQKNSYVEKEYDIDVSDYDSFILWISSREKGKSDYRKTTDYSYKIELADGKEYYLSALKDFYWVRINISDLETINKIKITSLHDDEDYLVLNSALVSTDDFPVDIFQAVVDEIENIRDEYFLPKEAGTVTCEVDDTSITVIGSSYLDRYMVIKIKDETHSEIHQLSQRNGDVFSFTGLFDGSKILYDYTDAIVEIHYPVLFGTTQKEICLPAITVWGFSSDREDLSSDLDNIIDTVRTDDTFEERRVGQFLLWDLLIDCESKEEWELFDEVIKIVRNFVGKRILWVNGMRCNLELTSKPTEMLPTESFDIIPKIQFPVNVSIREELYAPKILPSTVESTVSVDIKED